MPALHMKLLRDLVRLWPQALAIALVMAAGVTTMVLGVGAHASLDGTREAYYERNRFAHVFASVTRAPKRLETEIAEIPGVAAVETRVREMALIDVPGVTEPASGIFVSLPDTREPRLNQLFMREGRTPTPGSDREIVVNEAFALAHGFGLGDTFSAILDGARRELEIVGIALSPEFIYALGPWDLMPDDRRLAVVWMSEEALAAAYDLDGAFSDVSVLLMRGASEGEVIDRLDAILERYGGLGAYDRDDQTSHAFIDAELTQLEAMSRVLPPIFLLVAAFLVNMTMNRLIALEREQIGLLKALGYSGAAIALHYLLFVSAIGLIGVVIGAAAGTWLGAGMTRLYGDFFHFPFLIFDRDPATYALATIITLAAALLGALKAVLGVARLPPAVAMRPPAPPRFQQGLTDRIGLFHGMGQLGIMVVRQLVRYPVRAAMTTIGIAMSVAVLVGSLWAFASIDFMIDITYYQSDRQDASINFAGERDFRAVFAAERLPGVLRVEPYRVLSARLRNGPLERRVAITGKTRDASLSRVLNVDLDPIALPETGIVLSDKLAALLEVERGDLVEVELLEGSQRTLMVPVTETVQGYLGLMAYMDLDALNRLNFEGPVVTGVHLAIDPSQNDALMAELKETPAASFIALQRVSLQKFQETLAQNFLIMIMVYVTLAGIIAFGVVYNAARISLSERGRELASLCVLGFTRAEVSRVLLSELAILTLIAQPIGWLIGYGMAVALAEGLQSDLYRVPFIMSPETYATASLVVIGATVVSALMVRGRIDRLDMIEVLKTRE